MLTHDGVSVWPRLLGISSALPSRQTPTAELVVPRSIPTSTPSSPIRSPAKVLARREPPRKRRRRLRGREPLRWDVRLAGVFMARTNGGAWSALLGLLSRGALGAAPAPEILPIEVTADEVSLAPDFQAHAITGEERVRFRAGAGGARVLRFSPHALVIDSATLDRRPLVVGRASDALRFDL